MHTPYEARFAETKMTCDLEIFAAYVIANYRLDLACNRNTTGGIFHNIRSKVSTRLHTRNSYMKSARKAGKRESDSSRAKDGRAREKDGKNK